MIAVYYKPFPVWITSAPTSTVYGWLRQPGSETPGTHQTRDILSSLVGPALILTPPEGGIIILGASWQLHDLQVTFN
ncbi:MAG: hypothetical protein IMY80_02555 [Chloroflexi bacterium]|nr:hypothetical protein [Chloroflexota bacterium]